jgi:type 1 glutamine amidotransferase
MAGEPTRVVYYDVGSNHGSSTLAGKLLAKLGQKRGAFVLEECDDARKWSDEYLGPYAAIVLFAAGDPGLTEANKRALIGFVRRGKGFVGVHSASQFCRGKDWEEYYQLLGAVYTGGLGQGQIRVTTEDRMHPATRHLEPSFSVTDDCYRFRWSRERTHVLLSLDIRCLPERRRYVDGKEADMPVSWCHPFGKGRVFYTTLGHGEKLWNDEWFQLHVFQAIRWAVGDVPAKVRLGTDYRIREVRRQDAPRIHLARAPGR